MQRTREWRRERERKRGTGEVGGGDNLLACAQPQMREISSKCGSCGALFPCLPGVSSTAAEWRPRHCREGSRAAVLPRQSRPSNALLLCIVRARPNQETGWRRRRRLRRRRSGEEAKGMMCRHDRAASAALIEDVDDDDERHRVNWRYLSSVDLSPWPLARITGRSSWEVAQVRSQ